MSEKRRSFIRDRRPTATVSDQRSKGDQRTPITVENYTIEEALEIFIKAKIAEGVRPRTIKDYRQHMKYFTQYVNVENIDDITPELIRDYVIYLKDEKPAYEGVEGREKASKGLSANTINMRLRTLKTMCKFWHGEGMITSNPMNTIKPVKDDEQEEVPGLSDTELDKLLSFYDKRQFAEFRDYVLIMLLLDTGMRINEAVGITVDRIDWKISVASIPSQVAKNRRNREVPISREVLKMLKEMHVDNVSFFGEESLIFMNAYGEPFTADAFRRRLHRIKSKIGIERLHPHMLRHTFARNYLLNGGDLFTLQKILDHADIQTTRKYVQMDNEHIQAQHNKFSPIRKIIQRRP